jgi:phosphatidylserine synthase
MTHEGPRGRRKSMFTGVSIVLGIVAIMLAITANVTDEPKVLVAAVVVAVVAMLVAVQGRRPASANKPPKEETP